MHYFSLNAVVKFAVLCGSLVSVIVELKVNTIFSVEDETLACGCYFSGTEGQASDFTRRKDSLIQLFLEIFLIEGNVKDAIIGTSCTVEAHVYLRLETTI